MPPASSKVAVRDSRPSPYGSRRPPLIRLKDLGVLAKLPASAVVSWCLPQRSWDGVAGVTTKLVERLRPGPHRERRRAIAELVGDAAGGTLDAAYGRYRRNIRLDQFHFLRSYRPDGWRPELQVDGRSHIVDALAAGNGVILWIAPFVFSWLVSKRALAEAGVAVHHLSSATHGFSRTRFGITALNPIRTRLEDRYLAERIVIPADKPAVAAVRALAERLRANKVVSVTVAAEGGRVLTPRFFTGRLRLAAGAPGLALKTGAVILPVITVRTGIGRFLTTIERPLSLVDQGCRDTAMEALAAQLAERLEPHVLRWPDQFAWHLPVVGLKRESGP